MTSPLLYLTADEIGTPTGGGVVTENELAALRQLGEVQVMSRENLSPADDPWGWDSEAYANLFLTGRTEFPKLCHIYSGTWPTVVGELKRRGCKVSVTIAAHDRFVSRREHGSLGLQFPYPHLTDETLWQRYIKGYAEADLIICPSTVAADTVRGYGGVFESKPIRVIPHGCHIPHGDIKPPPRMFTVGYLGSYGADKGVRYLLEAWKKLAYRDAMLMLGGRDSTSDWVKYLIHQYGGGNIWCRGWMNDVSDFYNDCSLYVQPSACLLPGSLVYSDRGLVPVNELTDSDDVLTNDGSFREVVKPLRRHYSGDMLCIRTTGFGESVAMTPEHRLLVIKRGLESRKALFSRRQVAYEEAVKIREDRGWGARRIARELGLNERTVVGWVNYGSVPHDGHSGALRSLKEDVRAGSPQWIPASDLEKGDVVLFPRIKKVVERSRIRLPRKAVGSKVNRISPLPEFLELDQDAMKFFGFYVSEGCAGTSGDLIFCFHSDEVEYIRFVDEFLRQRLGLRTRIRNHKEKYSATVSTSSVLLTKFLIRHFGRGAHNKTLPVWTLLLPDDQLSALICGAWLGDGSSWQARRNKRGTCYSTVSKQLAYQMFSALVRLGFMPKLQSEELGYTLTCHGNDSIRFSQSILGRDVSGVPKGKKGYRTHIDDNFYYMPVTNISRIAYVGDVFNLEVDKNHCYCAPFIVHNSEGFGIEVLEAMAHGRPVLCSEGAGARGVVPISHRFCACSVDDLVSAIDRAKRLWKWTEWRTWGWREQSEGYTWDKIHRLYQQVWRDLL